MDTNSNVKQFTKTHENEMYAVICRQVVEALVKAKADCLEAMNVKDVSMDVTTFDFTFAPNFSSFLNINANK